MRAILIWLRDLIVGEPGRCAICHATTQGSRFCDACDAARQV